MQLHLKRVEPCLTHAPVVIAPWPALPFVLRTDASLVAVGAELCQIVDGKQRVVAYHSRKLNDAEKN